LVEAAGVETCLRVLSNLLMAQHLSPQLVEKKPLLPIHESI